MQKCNIYNCNIYVAQKYIKHKWIPIIIYLLNREQQMSFTSLLNNIEFISNKRLSASLKTLTDNSIIDKLENGEYVLTSTGSELAMIISLMSSFDGEYK
ncbi:winged helix-turn-helix transcriptional regulator [Mollicutes bacterium LVI A0039]|nr:winged helix-turn-helix transcriptional regulator [Mollicutes bacterium LVI A0039]